MSDPTKKEALLAELLTDALEYLSAPRPDCSCHISPPCHDCVEYSHLRDLIVNINDALSVPAVVSNDLPEMPAIEDADRHADLYKALAVLGPK